MPRSVDGPVSPLFSPVAFKGNASLKSLARKGTSEVMRAHAQYATDGDCVCWGVPFSVEKAALAVDKPVTLDFAPTKAPWLVFLHTAEMPVLEFNPHGVVSPARGPGLLGEHAGDYVVRYADGTEARIPLRRRYEIGAFYRGWGEVCFGAVGHRKPHPVRWLNQQKTPDYPDWGMTQCRTSFPDIGLWVNWLYAWENPHAGKPIVGLRIEPRTPLLLFGVTAGKTTTTPLRWGARRKALLELPKNVAFTPTLDSVGSLDQVQIDLGHVISVLPHMDYENETWSSGYNNKIPALPEGKCLVEYVAHPEARIHFDDGRTLPVARLDDAQRKPVRPRGSKYALTPVAPATQRVFLRVVDKTSRTPVAVKLHVHGAAGEYLAPVDRHRIPNPYWFEDYSCDYTNLRSHFCTYIPGETHLDLPLGEVFVEISKGLEIAPIRKRVRVTPATKELTFTLERVLPWRERGWVTADTHVHFLSPPTAGLEGAGEDVNVVNLLASQWGELMTNVGDFDGKTTFGSKEAGGSGEYLVRVGSENRQHTLGHISLLAYNGPLIAPMCTGGPDEAALGDPVAVLLTEWARQCRSQGGVVVIPHFPNPRAEHAVTIVGGDADAIEMTSWGWLYGGIDPYSLSDWYRYLNCGYFVPAVAGTDKMSADTCVGAVRTYARLPHARDFTLDAWKDAVRSGNTFVTYGPLVEFRVEGRPAGARIAIPSTGGTLDIEWEAASVTVPMSRVDLVVNGEIRESKKINAKQDRGAWRCRIDRSSWIALLVRGHYPDRPEIIAAHTSPVVAEVAGSPFFAAADALTILEQIEGALAYFEDLAPRADEAARKRMRLVLTSAYRALHNRLHQAGFDHAHTHATDHGEHHGNGKRRTRKR